MFLRAWKSTLLLQMIDAGHMVPRGQRNGAFRVRTVGVNLAGEPELPRRLQVAIETGQQIRVAIPREIGEVGYTAPADLGKQPGHQTFGGVHGPSVEIAGQAEKKTGDQVRSAES